MDAPRFNASVCNVVQMIPQHKITSCAHIAKLLGEPTKARRVNQVVKFLGQMSSPLPWHRVVSSSGIIASHGDLGLVQRSALEVEGVSVFTGSYGEPRVEFDRSGWFPERVFVVSEMDSDDEWGA
ncbi:6-O-methylguanine DNA methyltransferase [Boletus coccyginus]|nr:6-O-methylguanine DNA methyltransferase [Boletus coccyginus]KAI9566568.1 6-O-methylguanine DNA methyltransferase [Boletus coccyginus]